MQMSLQPIDGDTSEDMDIIDMDYELDHDDNVDADDRPGRRRPKGRSQLLE